MNTREEMLHIVPKGGVCAEIGVFSGDFSKVIYNTIGPSKLYLVDFFKGEVSSGDKNGENERRISLDKSYSDLLKYFKETDSVELYRGSSFDFLSSLPDGYLDFIYIDGDHSFKGVSSDLLLSRNKVKRNGIISGHDYCPRFSGVMKALDEFVNKFKLKATFTTQDKIPSFYVINK